MDSNTGHGVQSCSANGVDSCTGHGVKSCNANGVVSCTVHGVKSYSVHGVSSCTGHGVSSPGAHGANIIVVFSLFCLRIHLIPKYFCPSGVHGLPLGVHRQNVVAILNGIIFLSFSLSPLLFYQKEGS